jgi:hypothetical protein
MGCFDEGATGSDAHLTHPKSENPQATQCRPRGAIHLKRSIDKSRDCFATSQTEKRAEARFLFLRAPYGRGTEQLLSARLKSARVRHGLPAS